MSYPNAKRRRDYAERFSLGIRLRRHGLSPDFLSQLDRCHSDVERRILLGVSEPIENAPTPYVRDSRGKFRSIATK